jgi:hypothetical protein
MHLLNLTHLFHPAHGGTEMALLELVIREERHQEKTAKAAAAKQKGGKKAKPEKKSGDKGKARDESDK